MDLTEVGRTDQGRRLGEFQRPAVPQEAGHELGAEVVVTPVQREVEEAGEGTQQIVVVSLPLRVHSTDLSAEAGVYLWGDGQLIEAAGTCCLLVRSSGPICSSTSPAGRAKWEYFRAKL